MQGDWMVGLDKLPTFKNGVPLSAEALRRIGKAQDYLDARYSRVLAAQPILPLDTPIPGTDLSRGSMFIVHLHRYLRWSFFQTTSLAGRAFRMTIGGKRAVDIDSGSAPQVNGGVIDLNGNYLDGNPYALTNGRAYEIEWSTLSGSLSGVYGDVHAYNTYEMATNDNSFALPVTPPTFSGVVTDTQLNALTTDCKFLLESNGSAHAPGFQVKKSLIPAPSGSVTLTSYVLHSYNYVTAAFDVDMGYSANEITSTVKINGTQIYSDTKTKTIIGGGTVYPYRLILDVSSLGLTKGLVYRVDINSIKSQWDDYTFLTTYFMGESPVNTRPAW